MVRVRVRATARVSPNPNPNPSPNPSPNPNQVDSYLSLLLACDSDARHLDAATAHGLDLAAATREKLSAARGELRALLWGSLGGVLSSWCASLARECEDASADATTRDALLAANTKLLAKVT